MPTSDNIKNYYNDFSKDILIRDFHFYNLRQGAIKRLCKQYIPRNARILEIGCGVGIITKFVQKDAAFVLSLDISDVNVSVARLTAKSDNTRFEVLDITKEAEKIKNYGKFDVVLIFDVIEHIEKENYARFFSVLEEMLSDSGMILLTYPSPQYQEYLKENDPKSLQIVDQVVLLKDILNVTKLFPYSYSYKHVNHKNQYIHLVLKSRVDYSVKNSRSFWEAFSYRVKKYSWRYSNILVKKRINELFQKK